MNRKIPAFLLNTPEPAARINAPTGKLKVAFIDRTIRSSASFVRNAIVQYESPKNALRLTSISAQSMLIFFLVYIVCISLTHTIEGQLIFTGILFLLVLIAPVKRISIYRTALILSFLFGFLVMVPAALNVFSPGKMLITLVQFHSARTFLIYHIPSQIGITDKGMFIVLRMFIKVFNSLTLTFIILHSTTFYRLIKALGFIRVPSIFILIVTLSYKFIFIMAQTVEEMYLALRSRWIGSKGRKETRQIIAGRMGFLFRKSWIRYEEIYKAMLARGYTGELTLSGKEKMNWKEAGILSILTGLGIAIIILSGR
jgi:cobalt/nickel transport system permease protein